MIHSSWSLVAELTVWVGLPAEQKGELAFLPLQAARSEQPGVPVLTEFGGALGLFLGFSFLGAASTMQTWALAILRMVKTAKNEEGPNKLPSS